MRKGAIMAEIGERVRVHAVGRLENGLKFLDTYKVEEPLDFVVGGCAMLPAFERAVTEMAPGERRTVRIPAEEGYGLYDESLIEEITAADFPNADKLPVGQFIEIGTSQGPLRVKVLPPEGGMVRFDHNHELAGQDLIFDIELMDTAASDAIEREKHPAGCGCGCDRLKESLRA